MKPDPRTPWSEVEEIDFIDRLGSFSKLKVSRLELLRGYHTALRRRTTWTGINKGRVLTACSRAITKEAR